MYKRLTLLRNGKILDFFESKAQSVKIDADYMGENTTEKKVLLSFPL